MNSQEDILLANKEWFGSSYRWFFWAEFGLGVLISLSNGMILWMAYRSKKIRSKIAIWLVIALAFDDFIFGLDKVILLPFAFTYADKYPIICAIEGCVHFASGIIATC